MSLKYAGPKPLISAHGITFDLNKDDKFIYLSIVAELIQALNHEYVGGERYTHVTAKKPMDVDSILELIRRNDPLLDQEIQDRQKIVEQEIQEELERAYSNRVCVKKSAMSSLKISNFYVAIVLTALLTKRSTTVQSAHWLISSKKGISIRSSPRCFLNLPTFFTLFRGHWLNSIRQSTVRSIFTRKTDIYTSVSISFLENKPPDRLGEFHIVPA